MRIKKVLLLIATFILCLISNRIIAQNWYETAQQRIDTLRKGNFTIKVYDSLNNPITNNIKIILDRHEFPWGTVVQIPGTGNSNWALAMARKFYNCGVWGNEFKWPWLEPSENNIDYSNIEASLEWANRVGWDIRGHALLWGGSNTWQMPGWTMAPSLTASELYNECEIHVRREVEHFKEKVHEYDVINEPVDGHATWLQEKVGDSLNWNAFKWAREADPDAILYVNEYNVLIWDAGIPYKAKIQEMLAHGAPIDAIGVQGHMDNQINWEDIKTKADYIAELGLPMKVTEFDMKVDEFSIPEQKQANDYAKMMRIIFSHPAFTGFMFWGFADSWVWRPGSGIFNEDCTPKIAADSVYNLIHNVWTTKVDMPADVNNEYSFNGYFGYYKVLVDLNGQLRQFEVPALKAYEDSVFVLNFNDSKIVGPKYLSSEILPAGNQIKVVFDGPVNAQTIVNEGYYVTDKNNVVVNSITAQTGSDSIFIFSLAKNLSGLTHVTFTYQYDSLQGKNGGKVGYFGPEVVTNNLPGLLSAETDTEGRKIILTFSKNMSTTIPSGAFSCAVNGFQSTIKTIESDNTDQTKINIELNDTLLQTDVIKLSYTIKDQYGSMDGYVLGSIVNFAVTNNVTTVSSIKPINENLALELYPNPVQDYLQINGMNKRVDCIKVFDITGHQLFYLNVEQKDACVINTENFTPGCLVIVATSSNGNSYINKIVKK